MVILRKDFVSHLNVTVVIIDGSVRSKLACRAQVQIIRMCKSYINWQQGILFMLFCVILSQFYHHG